ncbi:C40 family peptidase, partial [Streptomyces sp. SID7958]|nr:C40 family peptidase [Streptomyces sp. SID7958]
DASHVGMYVGNGQVIHAPYPGAPVRHDPVGMMPISSVTRV